MKIFSRLFSEKSKKQGGAREFAGRTKGLRKS